MLRALGASTPVVNARPVRARDYSVEVQRSGPATLPPLYHNLHLVAVVLSGAPLVVRGAPAHATATRLAAGESYLRPAGPGERVTWPEGAHCLYVHLHPRLARRLGERLHGTPGLAPAPHARLRDPVIRDVGLALRDLVGGGAPADARRAEALVLALAHHVMASYAAPAAPAPRVGALPVEAVLDALRDGAPGGVSALAARCGVSRSHLSRRVCALAGLPRARCC
jgi:hypothetical protein